MRGRKPKPSSLKRLAGNPGRRPLSNDEPQPAAVDKLKPPAYLQPDARKIWRELAAALRAVRLFTRLDLWKLELLVIHLAHHRRVYAELTAAIATNADTWRLQRQLRQQAETVKGLAAGFGLDPSDRVRLHVEKPIAGDDPFAEFDEPPSKWAGMFTTARPKVAGLLK